MRKSIFSLLLGLLLTCLTPLTATAVSTAFHYETDRSSFGTYTVDCNNQMVTVSAKGTYQTGYLLVRICDQNLNVQTQSVGAASQSLFLSTSSLSDGIYYVELFTGSNSSGNFTGYASGKSAFQIYIQNGIVSNYTSDVWIHNAGIFAKNRIDDFALAYYSQTDTNTLLSKLALQITENCSDSIQKIKAVHDWVTANICYDYDHTEGSIASDAASVYALRYATAQGYANLTADLLRRSGIPAKIVSGYVPSGNQALSLDIAKADAHTWNEAYNSEEKRWVLLDTCWDSAGTAQNGVLYMAQGSDRYLDCSLEAFSLDHLMENNEDTSGLKTAFQKEANKAVIQYSRTTLYTGSVNHTATITVTLPDSLKNARVSYASSKSVAATVTSKGALTGKGYGKSNITVKISDGVNSASFKQTVKVYNPFLSYSKSTSSLKVGKNYTFAVKKYGVSGTVKWSVSNSSLATISSTGKLTAKKAGTVTVTATIGAVKKSIKVKITK